MTGSLVFTTAPHSAWNPVPPGSSCCSSKGGMLEGDGRQEGKLRHATSQARPCCSPPPATSCSHGRRWPRPRRTPPPSCVSLENSVGDPIHAPLPPASSGSARTRRRRVAPGHICQVCGSPSPLPHPRRTPACTTAVHSSSGVCTLASVTPARGGLGLVCDLWFPLTSAPHRPSYRLRGGGGKGRTAGEHALCVVGACLKVASFCNGVPLSPSGQWDLNSGPKSNSQVPAEGLGLEPTHVMAEQKTLSLLITLSPRTHSTENGGFMMWYWFQNMLSQVSHPFIRPALLRGLLGAGCVLVGGG